MRADLLSGLSGGLFGGDDAIVVWEAPGQYVRIVKQDWARDHRKAPRNAHPAPGLNAADLAIALASIRAADPESEQVVQLFSVEAVQALAPRLQEALQKAGPKQDVVFAVIDGRPDLGASARRSTAGRLFVHDGRLNIIFGDALAQARDRDQGSASQYAKPHRAGKRMEVLDSSIFVQTGPGIGYGGDDRQRRTDWVSLDVPAVVAAYRGPELGLAETVPAAVTPPAPAAAAQSVPPAAARAAPAAPAQPIMSRPVPATAGSTASSSVLQTDSSGKYQALEERLTALKAFHERGLITDEEYAAKRQEILDDL